MRHKLLLLDVMHLITYIFFLLFLVFFSSVSTAENYQDADLLRTLVEKEIITQEEATELKKRGAEQCVLLPESKKKFRTFFIVQARYAYAHYDEGYAGVGLSDSNRFYIRRFIPVFIGDVTENSRVMVTLFMPSGNPLNTAHYEVDFEGDVLAGKLMLGYWSVNYATEECDSCTHLYTPDRSFLCLYFGGYGDGFYQGENKTGYSTVLGFSGYHAGAYWHGYHPKNKELKYSVCVVNSQTGMVYSEQNNGIGTWLTFEYETKNRPYNLRTGVNLGYSVSASSLVDVSDPAHLPSKTISNGDIYGFNPYLRFSYEDFTFHAEMMYAHVEHGKTMSSQRPLYTTRSGSACPWGFYVMGAYKLFSLGEWGIVEPNFKFTYLDTDGRGFRYSDTVHAVSNTGIYDKVSSYYFGFNWYLRDRYLKYTIGYEYYDASGSPIAGEVNKSGQIGKFIAQMQICF